MIRVGSSYDRDLAKIVPVNSEIPTVVDSAIGTFSLLVNIKRFDGSEPHRSNSCYNIQDSKYLDGSPAVDKETVSENDWEPNLRLHIIFTPKCDIKASELLFGNDFTVPIHNHVPAIPLATGLKFFSWFVNKSAKGEVYGEKPFLYGLAINSLNCITVNPQPPQWKQERSYTRDYEENLNSNEGNTLKIPLVELERKKFFSRTHNLEGFVFKKGTPYLLQFDTTSLNLADLVYAVSIPTYGGRRFDFEVSSYANEHLNNFNWTFKKGGYEGVDHGELGMVLNFALLDEE